MVRPIERLELFAVPGLPPVRGGDDLAALIVESAETAGPGLRDGDILIVAQKIVSKSERRYVDLDTVTPGARAIELAQASEKDPRVVEVILRESNEVVRHRPGVIIVEHRLGHVCANAGIDASNIEGGANMVLLLPEDPDASAAALRETILRRTGRRIAVVISDSIGRAWRRGTVGHAIGAAGLASLWDRRGETDMNGRELRVTEVAMADQIAAAAVILQGEGAEGRPVVLMRGFDPASLGAPENPAAALIRTKAEDLFR